ncbi:MAG: enoyl-CoA hydratase/isomerase family protein [Alicyclobacillus sp.]|nr:enoyl-CoA hydratase/isomerase family protein [Alicyclobacillus sp.]
MEETRVVVQHEGPVAVLTLNREQQLNALDEALLSELSGHLRALADDPGVRAVVLCGRGRAFAAGADIAAMQPLGPAAAERFARLGQAVFQQIERLPKPVIALIHGYALGGGLELALACDLRIAAHGAQLGQPEIRLGILPGFGGTQRLPRLVGRGRALQLLLTGERITADAALEMGLVNEVVAPDALYTTGLARARQLAELPPLALAWLKRAVYEGTELDLARGLSLEAALFGLCFATHDQKEGMAAFLAKRPPVFEGK